MADNRGEDVSAIRREYQAESLSREHLAADPLTQFKVWFTAAQTADPDDATSMILATADSDGMPSARVVLLKHYDQQGFCWYTDFESAKGAELAANPQASLLFYWRAQERQVRISGAVERLDRNHAEQYFAERPRGSQLSAAVSHQSHAVASRTELEQAVAELDAATADQAITCPERWGGYQLRPTKFEFWQGRANRLHDRFVFVRQGDQWLIERLAP